MAVKLRLARHGSKKRPFYRIVAADSRARRDGRFLEHIGTYDPAPKTPAVALKRDRVKYWLGQGAKPSATVSSILDRFMNAPDTAIRAKKRVAPKALAPAAEVAPAAEAAPAVEAAPAAEVAPTVDTPAAS